MVLIQTLTKFGFIVYSIRHFAPRQILKPAKLVQINKEEERDD